MAMISFMVILFAISVTCNAGQNRSNLYIHKSPSTGYPSRNDVPGQFPRRFRFGSASSAYQIEGAWDRDGKGPSIWDTMTHNHPESIADRSNGDVAINSYDFYLKDVKALKDLGMKFYRFSISWPRILPHGDTTVINEAGLQYYDRLIDALLENDIEPMITIYHWDLPQRLQQFGGWLNPIIVDYAVEYARVLFDRYGDRARLWFTFNEPRAFCTLGYGNAVNAPQMTTRGSGEYLCAHHVLLSHAKIYHLYKDEYFYFGGSIGMALDGNFVWPSDPNNPEHVAAADRAMQFKVGWFAHAIFTEKGDYPEVMRENIDRNSIDEGLSWSRLPRFTEEEIQSLKGSADFFGLNYYTSVFGEPYDNLDGFTEPAYDKDQNVYQYSNENWPVAASGWLRSIPEGFRDLMNWTKTQYNNPEIIITENGWSDLDGLEDDGRIEYVTGHLQAVLDAIWKDGCRVIAYTYWSLADNFEWAAGYTERFGIYFVDFNDPEKERIAKKSALFLKDVIESGQLP